jgi:adenylate cyclase
MEVDIAVLFADVRDSTALCERLGSSAFAGVLNQFYRTATAVLIAHDAIIDKLIGDEVMALFVPGIAGPDYRIRATAAAVELMTTLSTKLDLPVSAAVDAGIAYVGSVGSSGVVDFTALGNPVNIAARLQAQAAGGELILTDSVYAGVRERLPDAEPRSLVVRGRDDPVDVNLVRLLEQ